MIRIMVAILAILAGLGLIVASLRRIKPEYIRVRG